MNKFVGRWEFEGGVCEVELVFESIDDYVVLDGYEIDVEFELSGFDELY